MFQLAAAQLNNKAQAVEKAAGIRARKEVRGRDLARRENAAARLASVSPLSLPPFLPSSSWLGGAVMGAVPIDTSTRQFKPQAKQNGLHVVELSGGIGLGALRAALAANYKIRSYTYVDKDVTSRRIAKTTLSALQLQYPD